MICRRDRHTTLFAAVLRGSKKFTPTYRRLLHRLPANMSKAARLAEEAKAGIYDPNLLNEKIHKAGEKALSQNTLFAAFPKVEDSIMWYTRAAETFRKSLLWEEAGDCYRRIAENEKLIGNIEEAGTSYVDCAHMYERVNWKTATVHYKTAISMFSSVGHFSKCWHPYTSDASLTLKSLKYQRFFSSLSYSELSTSR